MKEAVLFAANSLLLGAGLAMDAFSVSVADGLACPGMKWRQKVSIAGTFAFFQFLMPLSGWFCVHFLAERFALFQRAVPYIALILLFWIGGNMIREGMTGSGAAEEAESTRFLTWDRLLMQGVATSIDALSAGLTMAGYNFVRAAAASLIIAAVTFLICMTGIRIGRFFGLRLAGKASVLGGCILLLIGLNVFIKNVL